MNRRQNQKESSVSFRPSVVLLLALLVFFGVHVLLSSLGLVPTEVSGFNRHVAAAISANIKPEHASVPAAVNDSFFDTEPKSESFKATAPGPRENLPELELTDTDGAMPTHIAIEKLDISTAIENPESVDVNTLDAALKEGVVHYPDSGGVGSSRRMFLFGHSSRLPFVQNKAYQSFNGLDKLETGDQITVSHQDGQQTYAVESVEVVKKDEALIDLSAASEPGLTISTCATFGTRDNRIVVRAQPV